MKLISIVTSATKKDSVVLRADLPVTKDILEALNVVLKGKHFGSVSLDGDCIAVTPGQLERFADSTKLLSDSLTQANETVEQNKKDAKRDRDSFLQQLSSTLGLVLE